MSDDASEQASYEAGLQAWQDCLPVVLARVPDDDTDATAFVAGFLEATLVALLSDHDAEHVKDMLRVALGAALIEHDKNPINPAEWRQQ